MTGAVRFTLDTLRWTPTSSSMQSIPAKATNISLRESSCYKPHLQNNRLCCNALTSSRRWSSKNDS